MAGPPVRPAAPPDAPPDVYARAFAAGWRLEPPLSVSEWADAHRVLGAKATGTSSRWQTAATPYLRGIMDALSVHHAARRIVFQKGVLIGATEAGINWMGYIIDHAPGPTMIVWPSVDLAKDNSKIRLTPMIETTPAVRERIGEGRGRDSGNTILFKRFPGGFILVRGANSGSGLRSLPVVNLFADEVDGYKGEIEKEGDPLDLAEKRTSRHARRRKIFVVSTPTVRFASRIEREFLATDQRRYFVPCRHCGHYDFLTWSGFRDFVDREDGGHHRIEWDEHRPETAHMICGHCGRATEESGKPELLAAGEWRPTAPGDGATIGFHLSGLYSPLGWLSWGQIAAEFLAATEDVSKLRVWVNTRLGETWQERGDSVKPEGLLARLEHYPAEVPDGVGVLVAAVDVQVDRLECVVKAYGAGEESWLIAWQQFHGDPEREGLWLDLDTFLRRRFPHASGQRLSIECVAVDSNYLADRAYRFCKARADRRVYAVRGGQTTGQPLIGRATMNNAYRTKLFTLCTDTAKETIYSRLTILPHTDASPAPGCIHLPGWTDHEYIAQLTAERALRKYVKGRGSVRVWEKVRPRNEALDLEVYALAALYIRFPGPIRERELARRAKGWSVRPPDGGPATPTADDGEAPARAVPRRVRRTGWMTRW